MDRIIDTDPYCIIHTSGSTGIPKGVGLNHRSTIDFIDWSFDTLNLDGIEVMASLAPIYCDAYTLEFWMMLSKGSTWVVVPDACATFPVKLVEFITKNPINFIFWVPTIMDNIANQDLLANADLGRITKVFFIGEVFPTKHLNHWRRHLPQAMFVNLYGPIEIVVACTYYIVDREFSDDERIPVGLPMRNTEILILNDENKAAKLNEPGEVWGHRHGDLGVGPAHDARVRAGGLLVLRPAQLPRRPRGGEDPVALCGSRAALVELSPSRRVRAPRDGPNIGFHHVHHLNAAIPFYRLPEAMAQIPALAHSTETSLHPRDVRACLRLALWDPAREQMVPYP